MTVGDIINDFRVESRDLITPSRYRTALCLLWYNDAVRAVYSRRPEMYADIVMPMDVVVEATATTDTCILSDYAKRAITLFMLHKAAMYDLDAQKGASYYQLFQNELRGS